jgi:aminomethyltransferase
MSEKQENELKKSPLHAKHVEAGARLVDFAGWAMPVQYDGVLKEHEAVRGAAGIFDISHMGQVFISGPGAEEWLESLLTNRVSKLGVNQGQYTLMLNNEGGVIDDLILYRLGEREFFSVINAAKIEQDIAWKEQHLRENVRLRNVSAGYFGIALQGPRSPEVFAALMGSGETMPARNTIERREFHGEELIVCGTGYTGEDGCEFFGVADLAPTLWEALIEAGTGHGVKPCGLASRDVLRLEMGLPLNGNDLAEDRTPLEAGLKIFVSLKKPQTYPGKDILLKQKREGPKQKLVGLELEGRTPPPRAQYTVLDENSRPIGELCSGNFSPSLGKGIGMAYLPIENSEPGVHVKVRMRQREFPAVIVKKPFLKR